ncbi:MAG: 2-amino-4-hydroxy-6-hydroxymethyldihydropteridine diphosphokinase [Actinomycetes bacterium]
MIRIAIGLGSNLGDRLGHLQFAVAQLRAHAQLSVNAVSPVYETDPVGGPEQNEFFNAVVIAESDLSPDELLTIVQDIENARDRKREIHWGPRTLDVDLLAIGDTVIDTPTLVIPHPRIQERGFVLLPWAQVDPECDIPHLGIVRELALRVSDAGIERIFESDVFDDGREKS